MDSFCSQVSRIEYETRKMMKRCLPNSHPMEKADSLLEEFASNYISEKKPTLESSRSSSSLYSRRNSLKRNTSVQEFIQIIANWSIKEEEDINIQWIAFEPEERKALSVRNPDSNHLKIDTRCTFFFDDAEELSIDDTVESIATELDSVQQNMNSYNVNPQKNLSTMSPLDSSDNVIRSDSKMGIYRKQCRSKSVDYSGYLPTPPKNGYLSLFKREEKLDPCHVAYRNFQRHYRDKPLARVQSFIRSRSSVDLHRMRRDSGPSESHSSQTSSPPKLSRMDRVKSSLQLTSNLSLSKLNLFRRGPKLQSALF
jgi:hypothetical protein